MSWRLLLSHHHEDQAERCQQVFGLSVCRRCLIIYPLSLLIGVTLNTILSPLSESFAWTLVLLLPAPATFEHMGELSGTLPYAQTRATVLNVLMGIGIGVGLSALWGSTSDSIFWLPLVLYSVLWIVPWWTHMKA